MGELEISPQIFHILTKIHNCSLDILFVRYSMSRRMFAFLNSCAFSLINMAVLRLKTLRRLYWVFYNTEEITAAKEALHAELVKMDVNDHRCAATHEATRRHQECSWCRWHGAAVNTWVGASVSARQKVRGFSIFWGQNCIQSTYSVC